MLNLPTFDSPLRELFDMETLAEWRRLPGFRQALASGRDFLASSQAAESVQVMCQRADGRIWLLKVKAYQGRTTWAKLWDFGNPTKGSAQFGKRAQH